MKVSGVRFQVSANRGQRAEIEVKKIRSEEDRKLRRWEVGRRQKLLVIGYWLLALSPFLSVVNYLYYEL